MYKIENIMTMIKNSIQLNDFSKLIIILFLCIYYMYKYFTIYTLKVLTIWSKMAIKLIYQIKKGVPMKYMITLLIIALSFNACDNKINDKEDFEQLVKKLKDKKIKRDKERNEINTTIE